MWWNFKNNENTAENLQCLWPIVITDYQYSIARNGYAKWTYNVHIDRT